MAFPDVNCPAMTTSVPIDFTLELGQSGFHWLYSFVSRRQEHERTLLMLESLSCYRMLMCASIYLELGSIKPASRTPMMRIVQMEIHPSILVHISGRREGLCR